MEADLHNLWPSLASVNRARSNYRFGVIGNDDVDSFGATACDFEIDRSADVAEPAPSARGPLARSILYMADTYSILLPVAQRAVMLRWHCTHPVTDEERRRDDIIVRIQNNRNPYIQDGLRGCVDAL
jgi:deoxyribonuclease-1